MHSVFLDPGHNYSGSDTGAAGCGLKEQNITWYIADKVKKILMDHGIQVGMSRVDLTSNIGNTSVNDSLKARVKLANQMNTDIFVSIHCNAGGGTGTETFCYSTGGQAYTLANAVQSALVAEIGLPSRGIKTESLYVTHYTNMPSILVETAFIDTQSNADILGSDEGQAKVAKGIAKGILSYFGIAYKDNAVKVEEYSDVNAIVYELSTRGIVSDVDGMVAEMSANTNSRLYWLGRKLVQAIRTGEAEGKGATGNVTEYTDNNDIAWGLGNRGIVSDTDGLLQELNSNPDSRLYWLARKGLQMLRKMD